MLVLSAGLQEAVDLEAIAQISPPFAFCQSLRLRLAHPWERGRFSPLAEDTLTARPGSHRTTIHVKQRYCCGLATQLRRLHCPPWVRARGSSTFFLLRGEIQLENGGELLHIEFIRRLSHEILSIFIKFYQFRLKRLIISIIR